MGDNAASPIDLDDEDLSKLIDSISSKTPPSGLSGSFLVTDPCKSLQMRPVQSTGMSRSVMGPSPGKGTCLPATQVGQSSGSLTANSPGWKPIISSSVPFNADRSTGTQKWTDVEHKGMAGVRTMQGQLCTFMFGILYYLEAGYKRFKQFNFNLEELLSWMCSKHLYRST
jgi:hypothetical protein